MSNYTRNKILRKLGVTTLSGAMALSVIGTIPAVPVQAAETTIEITNGDFEDGWSAEGWTIEGFDSNFIKDADDYNDTKFMNLYKETGDAISLSQTLYDVEAGSYTLKFRSLGNDGVESGLTIEIGDTTASMPATIGWDTWGDVEIPFTVSETGDIELKISGTVADGFWLGLDDFSIEKDEASSEVEVPEITNGDFATGSTDGWNVNWSSSSCTYTVNNSDVKTNKLNFYAAEEADFELSQTISGVKAGKYKLSFDMDGESGSSGLSVSVGGVTKELEDTIGYDKYSTVTVPFEITEDGDLEIKISGTVPSKYWGDFDDFVIEAATDADFEDASDDNEEPDVPDVDPVDSSLYVERVAISDDFATGMDLSSYISLRNSGVKFKDTEGNELSDSEFFKYLYDNGTNTVRIRVWNDPTDENGNSYGGGANDVEVAKELGKLATDAGMKVLIDFHISDWWTDPGTQFAPKAWANYTVDEKAEATNAFIKESLEELINNGVNVTMVQVGNETTTGVAGETSWTNMCKIFNAGSAAVREVSAAQEEAGKEKIKVVLHFTNPEKGNYPTYAKTLSDNEVDYDVFATSYYPYWHGTIANLKSTLSTIQNTYDKEVMVAETSYVYTFEEGDGHGNTEDESDLGVEAFYYDVSRQGQADAIRTLVNAINDIDGIGVFWWEPAWIPVNVYDKDAENAEEILAANKEAWETYGSGWATEAAASYQPDKVGEWAGGSAVDNESVFDFDGTASEMVKIYNLIRTGTTAKKQVLSAVDTSVEVSLGEEVVLPDKIEVNLSGGTTEEFEATWNYDEVEAAVEAGEGTYTINGTVDNDGDVVEVSLRLIIDKVNILSELDGNPGFESGAAAWTLETGDDYGNEVKVGSDKDVKRGNGSLHFWYGSDFTFKAYQTVTLDKGIYNIGVYSMGESTDDTKENVLYVTVGDSETKTEDVVLSGYGNWNKLEISEIEVTEDGTEVTLGLDMDLAANSWGSFDDFYINKIGEYEESEDDEDDKPSTGDVDDKSTTPTTPKPSTKPEEKPSVPKDVTDNTTKTEDKSSSSNTTKTEDKSSSSNTTKTEDTSSADDTSKSDDEAEETLTWKSDASGWWVEAEDGSYVQNKWAEVDGVEYYFGADGYMASAEWIDGRYVNSDGSATYEAIASWKSDESGWWFEDESGWYAVNSWQKINGSWYYFDASGYMVSSAWVDGYWIGSDGVCSYEGVAGWAADSNGWYYADNTGWYAAGGWQKIDGNWYFFDAAGYMVTNTVINGYYIDANGICQ